MTTGLLMNEIQVNHRPNPRVKYLIMGRFVTKHEVSEEMAVWIQAVKQTGKEKTSTKVVGVMTKKQF